MFKLKKLVKYSIINTKHLLLVLISNPITAHKLLLNKK